MNSNYCAEIIDNFNLNKNSNFLINDLKKKIESSIKFRVPDNGIILDIKEKENIRQTFESYISIIKLPYQSISIEFNCQLGNDNPVPSVLLAEQAESEIHFRFFIKSSDGTWVFYRFIGLLKGDRWGKFKIGYLQSSLSHEIETSLGFRGLLQYSSKIILEFLSALNCSNIEIGDDEPVKAKLNAKRLKKNKTPYFNYKVLTIKPSKHEQNSNAVIGSHASPRVHLRRGHIRRLENKTVWVNACVVGDKSKGMVIKDYQLKQAV